MMDFPKIKIEVENMRYQIVHMFSQHNDEIEKIVDEQLKAAIKEYPFEKDIKVMAHDVIREALKRSIEKFFWSEEGHKIVDEVTNDALLHALNKSK